MRYFQLGLLFIACFSAQADPLALDFRAITGATPNVSSGTSYGNSITFTADGVSAKVTAWALTGTNDTTFESAYLGRWDTGLGVCNREEFCLDPAHQVDNAGQREFVLIQFSKPVDPMTITIDPYGSYDRDVTYYAGTTANPLNLTGSTLLSLAGLGFGSPLNSDSTVSNSARTVTLTSGYVSSLLFGARAGTGADNNDDRFKIASMTGASMSPTPEPSTLGLVAVAAIAGVMRRRRNTQSSQQNA